MEKILIALLIIFISIFGLSFSIGILSYHFDWYIEDECFSISVISIVLAFCIGTIGASLFG